MSITLALALAQAVALGPELPPGVNPALSETVLAVGSALEAGDFEAAERAARRLPKREVTLAWDESKVPVAKRAAFAAGRDAALQTWSRDVPGLTFSLSPKSPDVLVRFEPALAKDPTSGLPLGATLGFSDAPRLSLTIGLQRGAPAQDTGAHEVYNETVHAVGAYLGLATSPLAGSAMGRNDLPVATRFAASPAELLLGQRTLAISDSLRTAVSVKKRLRPARPGLRLETPQIVGGTHFQGERVPYTLRLTNPGDASLQYRIAPDCGCFERIAPGTVAPGATVEVPVVVDTTEFFGDLRKRLILFSNDPKSPAVVIPVSLRVTPRFRFLVPGGSVEVDDPQAPIDGVRSIPDGGDLHATDVALDGDGQATLTPWEGSLPDPVMGEADRPRKGFRIGLTLPEIPLGSRALSNIIASGRNNPFFLQIQYSLLTQRGIVSLPESLYMGQLTTESAAASSPQVLPPTPSFPSLSTPSDSPG